jgi:uncharacterized membrane protein YhiD involved in acid resistance
MNDTDRLDHIRETTLDRIDRSDRWFKGLIVAAGCCEVLGLVLMLVLMDFGNRTHVLILVAAMLVYLTIAFWTWALAAYANLNSQRILKAIDLLHRGADG